MIYTVAEQPPQKKSLQTNCKMKSFQKSVKIVKPWYHLVPYSSSHQNGIYGCSSSQIGYSELGVDLSPHYLLIVLTPSIAKKIKATAKMRKQQYMRTE